MKISHDPEVDALRIIFRETTVVTEHVAEGIALDFAEDGTLAGIEILDASLRLGGADCLRDVDFTIYEREPAVAAA
jgi:uncharacterized protein YuzE